MNRKCHEGTNFMFGSMIFWRRQMHPTPVLLPGKIPWTEEPGRLQSMGTLSWTRLSDFAFTFHFHASEKEMAAHSNILVWRIPGMGEPGGLPSLGLHRVGHDWSSLAAVAAMMFISLASTRLTATFQFSCSVMSNSLQLHGLQHARFSCPSSSPGACSNSCPLSWWCHPTISSSVIPFSSSLQSFPALASQLFPSGGQSIGVSASSSVLPMNIHDFL